MSSVLLPVPTRPPHAACTTEAPPIRRALIALSATTLVVGTLDFLESYALTKRQIRPLPLAHRDAPSPLGLFSSIALAEDASFLVVLLVSSSSYENSIPEQLTDRAPAVDADLARAPGVASGVGKGETSLSNSRHAPPCVLIVAPDTMQLLLRIEVHHPSNADLTRHPIACCKVSTGMFAVLLPPVVLVLRSISSRPCVVSRLCLDSTSTHPSCPLGTASSSLQVSPGSQNVEDSVSSVSVILAKISTGELHSFACVCHESGDAAVYDMGSSTAEDRTDITDFPAVLTFSASAFHIITVAKIVFVPGRSLCAVSLAYRKDPPCAAHSAPARGPSSSAKRPREAEPSPPVLFWILLDASLVGEGAASVLKAVTGLDDFLSWNDFPLKRVAVTPDARVVFCTRRGTVIALDPEVNPSVAFTYSPLALEDQVDPVCSVAVAACDSQLADIAAAHHLQLRRGASSSPFKSFIRAELFRRSDHSTVDVDH